MMVIKTHKKFIQPSVNLGKGWESFFEINILYFFNKIIKFNLRIICRCSMKRIIYKVIYFFEIKKEFK